MSGTCDFVIEDKKKVFIEQNQDDIEEIFDVNVSYPNGGSSHGQLWVTIEGDEEKRNKAKDYVKALTAPEQQSTVHIPDLLLAQLGKRSEVHKKLEFEYAVIIRYPQENRAVIKGSDVSVTLAASKLEDLATTLSQHLAPKTSTNQRNLEEFALKLGYEQEQITAVFDKLGPSVDRNTFLNELINIAKQKVRAMEDRRSPVPSTYSKEMYSRYPGDHVVSKGLPSNGGGNSKTYSSRGYLNPDGHGIVARGCGIRPSQNIQPNTGTSLYSGNSVMGRDYTGNYQANGFYVQSTNDFNQLSSDPRQEEQIFQDLLMNRRYKQYPQSDLRHIVIDGSNVAMSHGNNKVFSCKGIEICVNWFLRRGHTQITVFVPQWRKESAKPESPINDQYLLNQLEEQGYLTFTPARRVNGRRIVCYDDRFVVKLAESTDGIIVSNDNFKDLSQENPKWKEVIEQRLLMYSFVNDMFMPPEDPLGRHGPTLDEFLRKGTPAQRRVCPYGRRCTYGARCKYYHPEKEDKRLQVYQVLKDMFPSQDTLILKVMKKYPQERDPQQLASRILDLS